MKSGDEISENVEGKFKHEEIVRNEQEEDKYMNLRESNSTINTSENMTCCEVSRWVDKVAIVLFPTLFIGFNVVYWMHYLP